MKQVDMKALFGGLQQAMKVELGLNRAVIAHPGSKGDAMENSWIELLRKYLPNRYSVDKAMVIDNEGNVSDQIDIVVYDNFYTPFVFRQNGFTYVPAEGVYAVFEVKPDMAKHIKYAGDKIASVRRLKRTTVKMISTGKSSNPRDLTRIIGGILAIQCSWKKDTLEQHLKALKGFHTIDIGCAVDDFAYLIEYDNEDKMGYTDQLFAKAYRERTFKDIEYSEKGNSLVFLTMQLSKYIQQKIGTVSALDYQKYIDASTREEHEENEQKGEMI